MKKAELGAKLLNEFPEIQEATMEQIKKKIGHYMLFSTKRAKCTACGYDEQNPNEIAAMNLSHKVGTTCPNCKEAVIAMKSYMGYDRNVDRNVRNFAIFLAKDGVAFVRCIRVRCNLQKQVGEEAEEVLIVEEHQRYAFAENFAFRYGQGFGYVMDEKRGYHVWKYGPWNLMTKFTEPIFQKSNVGYYADNSYTVLGKECLKDTCLKYSMVDQYGGVYMFKYLAFYMRHKNVEYLMKSGFGTLVNKIFEPYRHDADFIDWKQNDIRKMLGVNSFELRLLKQNHYSIVTYRTVRSDHPDFSPEECIRYGDIIGYQEGTLDAVCKTVKEKPKRVLKYLWKQGMQSGGRKIRIGDFKDYLDQCKTLKYDMKEHIVLFPRNLAEAHDRATDILNRMWIEREAEEKRKRRIEQKRQLSKDEKKLDGLREFRDKMAFAKGDYLIRQPESLAEIVDEGAIMNHCVGGYAGRHADGKLHIMFLRTREKQDVPYYTMEVSTEGKIVQVRAFRNGAMTQAVKAFVEEYKQHLSAVFAKEQKRQRVRASA